jgi:hypothetical protein
MPTTALPAPRDKEALMSRFALAVAIAGVALAVPAVIASASAPPVGPLPKGPVTSIQVQHGLLFAIALPRPNAPYVWRGARPSDPNVARPLEDAEVSGNIVILYKAVKAGKTSLVYALTKGETEKAYKAETFKVTVS